MNWITNSGKKVSINIHKYSIDWEKRAPSKGAQKVKEFLLETCPLDHLGEEIRIPRTLLRVDFINWTKRFAIEFDGQQHEKFTKHWHGTRAGFLASIKRDMKKYEELERNGLKLVIIKDSDLPLTREYFSVNYEIYL
jgi:hypothetical protein